MIDMRQLMLVQRVLRDHDKITLDPQMQVIGFVGIFECIDRTDFLFTKRLLIDYVSVFDFDVCAPSWQA